MAQFLIVLILLAVLSTPGIILGVFIVRVISSRARKPTKGNKSIKQPHPDNWKSEWKWDEESQAWVHPRSKKPETQASREEPETNASPKPEINIDFAHAYQAQPLFTRNEWQNYKTLMASPQLFIPVVPMARGPYMRVPAHMGANGVLVWPGAVAAVVMRSGP